MVDLNLHPDFFICPLSKQLMENPVITKSGNSFEKREIDNWLLNGKDKDPISNEILEKPFYYENINLRLAIEKYKSTLIDNKEKIFMQTFSNLNLNKNIIEETSPAAVKSEIKLCRYFPSCKRQDCIYNHTQEKCHYDENCLNLNCKFLHTNKGINSNNNNPSIIKKSTNVKKCRYNKECKNTNCPFIH